MLRSGIEGGLNMFKVWLHGSYLTFTQSHMDDLILVSDLISEVWASDFDFELLFSEWMIQSHDSSHELANRNIQGEIEWFQSSGDSLGLEKTFSGSFKWHI